MRWGILTLVAWCGVAGAQEGVTLGSVHRGGVLHLSADASGGTLDPQINYGSVYPQLFANVYDQLVTYRKARGDSGDEIVPDLVRSMPEVSADGLTWRMVLRPGLRFSDGRPVRVEDVVASMRRIFTVGSPTAAAYYGAILGAQACLDHPAGCVLPGVEGDARTGEIVFHLSRPDGEFLQKLSFPHASILPADTPVHDVGNDPVPATGPYRIVSYDPDHEMVLTRNPYFHVFSAEAQPDGYVDRIEYRFGLSDEAEVTAVENGTLDWMIDPKPQDRLGELGARFADQTHIERMFGLYYLTMNVHEKPFDSVLVRQAVNDAVDRHAMTILYGGGAVATPAWGMTPLPLPGADVRCFYGAGASFAHPSAMWNGPDLVRARDLVARSGRAGAHVTLVVPNRDIEMGMGTYLRNMLEALGFVAEVRPVAEGLALNYTQNTDNHVQISLARWYADYPSASNYLDDLFGCENFQLHSDSSMNAAGYCSAPVQALMDRARGERDMEVAAGLWREAGEAIMKDAPGAPLIQIRYVDFVSKRVGNYFYTDLYHLLFSQVWVQ